MSYLSWSIHSSEYAVTMGKRLNKFVGLRRWREPRFRDTLIIAAVGLVAFAVAAAVDAFEKLHAFAVAYDSWQIDELFILSIAMCICGLIYSVRRVRELSVEIKARQVAELEAQRLAFHDPLTGLPNRRFFSKKLQETLCRCGKDRRAAVLALDLNYFKSLNDIYGHAAGDEALVEFADRISAVAPSGSVISRLGGDEFAIIQPQIDSPTEVTALARRIIATAAEPILIGGTRVSLGVGVGIAIAPDNGIEPDRIMRRADLALYSAKADGDSLIRFFEPHMDQRAERRTILERELRDAIRNDAIDVHYQPQFQLATNRITGFEALARWTSPTLGPVAPTEFIAVAEECGLIYELGEMLLGLACREATRWPPDLILSFNISPLQMRSTSFGLRILSMLAETNLSPHRLELEITESVLVRNAEAAQRTVDELRAAGVRIALDDFGTGYASMSQLMALRFDKIKIDPSFTHRLGIDPLSDVIVRATVGMAKGLGLITAAEGIELPSQLEALRATGCTEGQGFLFCDAVPASEIPGLLGTREGMTDSPLAQSPFLAAKKGPPPL